MALTNYITINQSFASFFCGWHSHFFFPVTPANLKEQKYLHWH